jgi:hypothetical protein
MRYLALAFAVAFAAGSVSAQELSGPPSPTTGTGNYVRADSPSLTTPALGVASATSLATSTCALTNS